MLTRQDAAAALCAAVWPTLPLHVSFLGQGSYAKVFRASTSIDSDAPFTTVLKITRADVGIAHDVLREIYALTNISHPHIIKLEGVWLLQDVGGCLLTAMRLPSFHVTLYDVIATRKLPLHEVLYIFSAVCEAVQAAHAAHFMHRDIKSTNILLRTAADGTTTDIVLADWGMSRNVAAAHPARLSGNVITSWYAPPEVLIGASYDMPADVWSCGMLLLELLTTQAPAILDKHRILHVESIIDLIGERSMDALEVKWLLKETQTPRFHYPAIKRRVQRLALAPSYVPGQLEPIMTSDSLPASIRRVLRAMLNIVPEARPSIDIVLEYLRPYVTPCSICLDDVKPGDGLLKLGYRPPETPILRAALNSAISIHAIDMTPIAEADSSSTHDVVVSPLIHDCSVDDDNMLDMVSYPQCTCCNQMT